MIRLAGEARANVKVTTGHAYRVDSPAGLYPEAERSKIQLEVFTSTTFSIVLLLLSDAESFDALWATLRATN